MSQQLNLLSRERRNVQAFTLALMIWGGIVLVLLAAWGGNQLRLSAAKEVETVAAREFDAARATVKQRDDKKAALLAEIEAIKPAGEAAGQLLQAASDLGNPKGFASYFMAMAGVTEEGLWLTGISVAKAGKSIRVEGQTLNTDAVMKYSRNLNAAFEDRQIKFSLLKIDLPTKKTVTAQGAMQSSLTSTRFELEHVQ